MGVITIRRNKLRTMLSMLGMIFGAGAVVAMLAIGEGASYEAQERIRQLGSRSIIIKSVKPPEDDQKEKSSNLASAVYGLRHEDAQRIKATVPDIEALLSIRETRKDVWNRAHKIDTLVRAVDADFLSVTGRKVEQGRFINRVDLNNRQPVCVVSGKVRQALFPDSNPMAGTVKIGGTYYRVIGVLENTGGSQNLSADDISENAGVLLPLTTANERFGKTIVKQKSGSIEYETVELHMIWIKVHEIDDVIPVSLVLGRLLAKFHKKKDYELVVPLKLLEEIRKNARMFSLVLAMIAAISLLVGGIGIMNIMLATVSERTREIGIRRAMGAKQRDIMAQFLTETIVLSVCGGMLGLCLGIALPLLITLAFSMKIIFTTWSFVLAFSISTAVGTLSGIYPALQAAKMDPIEALRHE
jgi:putative ABC transport system permease protein